MSVENRRVNVFGVNVSSNPISTLSFEIKYPLAHYCLQNSNISTCLKKGQLSYIFVCLQCCASYLVTGLNEDNYCKPSWKSKTRSHCFQLLRIDSVKLD